MAGNGGSADRVGFQPGPDEGVDGPEVAQEALGDRLLAHDVRGVGGREVEQLEGAVDGSADAGAVPAHLARSGAVLVGRLVGAVRGDGGGRHRPGPCRGLEGVVAFGHPGLAVREAPARGRPGGRQDTSGRRQVDVDGRPADLD